MLYTDNKDAVLHEKLKFVNVIENDEKAGNRLHEAMCMQYSESCVQSAGASERERESVCF
jgi:hypothetical protein